MADSTEAKVLNPVTSKEALPKNDALFTKQSFLESDKYLSVRDIINCVMQSDEQLSIEELDKRIQIFSTQALNENINL